MNHAKQALAKGCPKRVMKEDQLEKGQVQDEDGGAAAAE